MVESGSAARVHLENALESLQSKSDAELMGSRS